MISKNYDIAVIGGGILGCTAALRLQKGGMKTILIEQGDLGQGASGVNAGTLSLQIKRVKLMPYALRGHEIWAKMGDHVGFRKTGGYMLAFNEREADLLEQRTHLKREAGAPIELVTPATLLKHEPLVTQNFVAASYCSEDGYANASLTGQFYRKQLNEAGIPYLENTPVTAINTQNQGVNLVIPKGKVSASRILLACGAWLKHVVSLLDFNLPINTRINTVSVLERCKTLTSSVLLHATGLLTMKQKSNGTILIGGGWQGRGDPQKGRGEVVAESLIQNLQLAQYVLPGISGLRLIRSWTGFEANTPDYYPIAGTLPGFDNIYVLGCVRGGYTIGPYIGKLMGDFILGQQTEFDLFDPARNFNQR